MALIKQAPLFIHHHGNQDVTMPSRSDWEKYSALPEFQKVLPEPIVKTVQASNGLRGFKVYSIFLSDGDKLAAYKMLTKDNALLLVLQVHSISATLEALKQPGQPINVFNKFYTVHPDNREIPESNEMNEVARILAITTWHLIYSMHLERSNYTRG